MESQLEILSLKRLMELPGLSRFRLQHQIFFDECFYLFPGCYFGDILLHIDERFIELEFVIEQLRQNELHLRVKLPNLQTLQIFLLELPHHVCIVRNHGLKKPSYFDVYSFSVISDLKLF